MSGVGKTFHSLRLAALGYRRFSCDAWIARRLALRADEPDETIGALAAWMGFPDDERYAERAAWYRRLEAEALEDVLAHPGGGDGDDSPLVIDTTGSVVYLPDRLLTRLRAAVCVVHLETPPDQRARMLEAFLARPTPLIWGSAFDRHEGESRSDALHRCYARLLDTREKAYARLAHIGVGFEEHRRPGFDLPGRVRAAWKRTIDERPGARR